MYVMISFSVITCTYNAAAELPRTLKSVAEQTYPHVEHLLIDGLSTDNTRTLIDQYVADMAEVSTPLTIRVKAEADAGLYDAMNKGIEMATGTYLVFINAGDVFPSPQTLETVANAVGEAETLPAVLYGDTNIVDADGRFLRGPFHIEGCRGDRLVVACWCAIRPFTPSPRWPNKRLTT